MYAYKTVPAPTNISVASDKDRAKAVETFSGLINAECKDGWDFYSMENLSVSVKPGCLASLFGAKETFTYFNMLVFKKEV